MIRTGAVGFWVVWTHGSRREEQPHYKGSAGASCVATLRYVVKMERTAVWRVYHKVSVRIRSCTDV